jgi:hypothetical protein
MNYHQIFNRSNAADVTSLAGYAYSSRAPEFTPSVFDEIHAAQSLVILSSVFCIFNFDLWIICFLLNLFHIFFYKLFLVTPKYEIYEHLTFPIRTLTYFYQKG